MVNRPPHSSGDSGSSEPEAGSSRSADPPREIDHSRDVERPQSGAAHRRVDPRRVGADESAGTSSVSGAGEGESAGRHSQAAGSRKRQQKKKGSFLKELVILVISALVLTALIQTFIARVYLIPSASMEQTLHGCTGCSNDRVLVDKVSPHFGDPRPGDVVVFKGPPEWTNPALAEPESDNVVVAWFKDFASSIGLAPPNEEDFVKRVIATGGQTVSCCDQQNRVVVDGKPLDEPYLYFPSELGQRQKEFPEVTVPDGKLWVMGDNRNNSADARAHGPIPVDSVIGEAQVIVLPVSRWSGIPDPNPQAAAVGMALLAVIGRRRRVLHRQESGRVAGS